MNEESNFQAEIEKMAYNLYVQRGMVEGHDLDDWFQAEKIVSAQHAKLSQSKTGTAKMSLRKGRLFKEEHTSHS